MPNYRTKRPYAFLSLTALLSAGIACIPLISAKADGAGLLPLDLNSASIAEGLPPPPPPAPVQETPADEPQAKPATSPVTSDGANGLSLDLDQNTIAEGLPKPVQPQPVAQAAPVRAEGSEKLQLALDSASISEGLPKPAPKAAAPAPVAQPAPVKAEGTEKLQLELDSASIAEGLPKPVSLKPAPAPAPVAQAAPATSDGANLLSLDLNQDSIAEGLPKPAPSKPAPAPAPAAVAQPAPVVKAEGTEKLQLELDSASIAEGLAPPSPPAPAPASAPVQVPQTAAVEPQPAPPPAPAPSVQAAPPAPANPVSLPVAQPMPAPKPVVNVAPPAAPAAPAASALASPPRPAPRPTPRNASNDVFETMRQQGSQSPYTVPNPEPRPMASNTTPPIQTLRSPNRARSESWDNFMSDSRQQGGIPNKAPEASMTPVPQAVQPAAPVAKSTLAPVTPAVSTTMTSPTTSAPTPAISNIAPTPLTEEQSTYPKLSSQDSRPQAQLSAQDRENLRQQLESERVESTKVAGQGAPAASAAPAAAPQKMPSASLEDVYQKQLVASSSTVTTLTAGVERDRVLAPKRADSGGASANDGAVGNMATQTATAAKDTKIITSASLPMQSSSLSRVDFDGKSTVISAQAKAQLREVYRGYQQNNTEIEVIGLYQPKSDDAPRVISGGAKNSGDSDNAGLAARQAEAVSAHLLQLGVPMQSVNIIVRAADAGQGDGAGSWVEIQRGSGN